MHWKFHTLVFVLPEQAFCTGGAPTQCLVAGAAEGGGWGRKEKPGGNFLKKFGFCKLALPTR